MNYLNDKRISRESYFIDHGDGTVTDTRSGLIWMRCGEGQIWDDGSCKGDLKIFFFTDALAIQRNFSGHDNWRLPSIDELKSLTVTQLIHDPAFPFQSERYFWTSSRHDNGELIIFSPRINRAESINAVGISRRPVQLVRNNLEFFVLDIEKSGTGSGTITRSVKADSYAYGSKVTLTAHVEKGSVFKGWHGDVIEQGITCTIVMDSFKTIRAEFTKIKLFNLEFTKEGTGDGLVICKPQSSVGGETPKSTYFEGSVVSLVARPSEGSRFKCWHGDAAGSSHICTITVNSPKMVIAEFERLESFTLNIQTCGNGKGTISCSPEELSYLSGTIVTLTALPSANCLFNGWQRNATSAGMNNKFDIVINSNSSVTAEFIKLDVVDLVVDIRFDALTDTNFCEPAFNFYLSVVNNSEKQLVVEIPLASYLTRGGEEIEQSNFISELLPVNKKLVIHAGTFRKLGLVFYKSRLPKIIMGDHLHVTIFQAKLARRLIFIFRCTDKKPYKFILIKSMAEDTLALDENGETSLEKLEILQRLTLLEDGMRDILRKLDTLQIPSTPIINARIQLATTQTLSDVLTWLATQDRVSLAALRRQLLPLDLLPSAIMDQLNEQALDLTGELALEEIDDEVVVSKEILDEVLANWNMDPS